MSYDDWLERPYQEAYARAEAHEAVAEELGLTEEEIETFDFDSYIAERDAEADIERYIEYQEALKNGDYDY
jgi:hypothetical protein